MVMVVQEDRLRFNYGDGIKVQEGFSGGCVLAGDQDMLSSFKWTNAWFAGWAQVRLAL